MKALVYRARSSLVARREARELPCEEIREQLANLRGGSLRRTELRLHLRECSGCRDFREQVRRQRQMLSAALPVAPTFGLKTSVLAAVGIGGGAAGGVAGGGAAVAGGATVAKLAAVAVIAAGGVAGGAAVVVHERHAEPAPTPNRAHGASADFGDRARSGSSPVATGAEPTSAPAQARSRRGRGVGQRATHAEERTPPGQLLRGERTSGEGRGPIEAPPKSTPVRRGPPHAKVKPERPVKPEKPVEAEQACGRAAGAVGARTGRGREGAPRAEGEREGPVASRPRGPAAHRRRALHRRPSGGLGGRGVRRGRRPLRGRHGALAAWRRPGPRHHGLVGARPGRAGPRRSRHPRLRCPARRGRDPSERHRLDRPSRGHHPRPRPHLGRAPGRRLRPAPPARGGHPGRLAPPGLLPDGRADPRGRRGAGRHEDRRRPERAGAPLGHLVRCGRPGRPGGRARLIAGRPRATPSSPVAASRPRRRRPGSARRSRS